jgi:hypothetical protein
MAAFHIGIPVRVPTKLLDDCSDERGELLRSECFSNALVYARYRSTCLRFWVNRFVTDLLRASSDSMIW